MATRTSGFQSKRRFSRRGFSLIELLLVLIIMVVMIGMIGSLMGAFVNFSHMTDDQSIASRRARDVFNALEPAIRNAGAGIPNDPMSIRNYFKVGAITAPVAEWEGVLSVVPNTNANRGNALRILYAFPAKAKNAAEKVEIFGANSSGTSADVKSTTVGYVGALSSDVGSPFCVLPNQADTRAFITYAGADMFPLLVTKLTPPSSMDLRGKRAPDVPSGQMVLHWNTIYPFQDIYLVRGAVAYVDANSVFHMMNVNNKDPSTLNFPSPAANDDAWSGFRIEGIRAVDFRVDPDKKFLTVRVLAEGDVATEGRDTGVSSVVEIGRAHV